VQFKKVAEIKKQDKARGHFLPYLTSSMMNIHLIQNKRPSNEAINTSFKRKGQLGKNMEFLAES
jgi:hypothetical protein